MKNNIKKIFLLIFIFNLYLNFTSASEDFIFESKSIEFVNSTKTIIAKDGVEITSSDGMNISAFTSNYNKILIILSLEKNVVIKDNLNKIFLNSEKIIYDKNQEKIFKKKRNKLILTIYIF